VALQEVGPLSTLESLLARMPLRGGYGAPIMGTPDARGIRCALLSRVPVIDSRVHTSDALEFPVFYEGDRAPFGARLPLRRGIVVARVEGEMGGARVPVHVVVSHFKSRRATPLRRASGEVIPISSPRSRADAEVRSLAWRAAEALCVRGLVDDVLSREPDASVAVMGDLNDVLDSTTLRIVMTPRAEVGALATCASLVPEGKRFSILHEGKGAQFDHILVTATLRARLVSARILNEELREHAPVLSTSGKAPPPSPGSALPAPPTIDSDHAPFVARFE
jgi:endonuclease/exonuclease/phosphatase family metal-dependent hydrolase